MASQIVMPRMGLTMDEGTLVGWRKAEGEKVTAGEPLFEIETDKSTVEVEASESGVLGKILFPIGTTVPVGTVIAILVQEGELLPASDRPEELQMSAGIKASSGEARPEIKNLPVGFPAKVKASPAARTLAKKLGVD